MNNMHTYYRVEIRCPWCINIESIFECSLLLSNKIKVILMYVEKCMNDEDMIVSTEWLN